LLYTTSSTNKKKTENYALVPDRATKKIAAGPTRPAAIFGYTQEKSKKIELT